VVARRGEAAVGRLLARFAGADAEAAFEDVDFALTSEAGVTRAAPGDAATTGTDGLALVVATAALDTRARQTIFVVVTRGVDCAFGAFPVGARHRAAAVRRELAAPARGSTATVGALVHAGVGVFAALRDGLAR